MKKPFRGFFSNSSKEPSRKVSKTSSMNCFRNEWMDMIISEIPPMGNCRILRKIPPSQISSKICIRKSSMGSFRHFFRKLFSFFVEIFPMYLLKIPLVASSEILPSILYSYSCHPSIISSGISSWISFWISLEVSKGICAGISSKIFT